MKIVSLGLLLFCSVSAWAQNQVAPNFVWGAYHRGDIVPGSVNQDSGSMNIPAMVKFLTDNHIQTFNYLIGGHRLNDSHDYTNFIKLLEATQNTGIKIWITLRPTSESAGSVAANTGQLGPDEASLVNTIQANSADFVAWFKLCSLVASKYPHFVGVNIDDFINNADNDFWYSNRFFTTQILDAMKANLRFYNTPNLSFIATTYIGRTIGDTYTITKKDSKWLSVIDVLLLYNENYVDDPGRTFNARLPAVRRAIEDIAGPLVAKKLPIVAGIYTSGVSWYDGKTPPSKFVRKMLDYASSSLDGVMIFKTQNPISDNEKIVYSQFEKWASSQYKQGI